MNPRTGVLLGTSLFCSTQAFAECPTNLPIDEMITCLTVESSDEEYGGVSQNYQDYLIEVQKYLESDDPAATIPRKKQTSLGLYITAVEAYDMKSQEPDGVLFVDIRTKEELAFLGTPTVADVQIPYMTVNWETLDAKKGSFKMMPNSNFLLALDDALKDKGLTKKDRILLMCRSGSRSARAANLLAKAGYTNVYNITDGYEGDKVASGEKKGQRLVNGWKNSNLPWTYKLSEKKLRVE